MSRETVAILRGLKTKYEGTTACGSWMGDPRRGEFEQSVHRGPVPAGQGDRSDRRGPRAGCIENDSMPTELDELRRRIMQLELERETLRLEAAEMEQIANKQIGKMKATRKKWSASSASWRRCRKRTAA